MIASGGGREPSASTTAVGSTVPAGARWGGVVARANASRGQRPCSGVLALAYSETATGYTVRLATGGTRRIDTDPSGLATEQVLGADGRASAITPNGTVTRLVEGLDSRFGMQAPLPSNLTITTPGGLRSTMTTTRTATLATGVTG